MGCVGRWFVSTVIGFLGFVALDSLDFFVVLSVAFLEDSGSSAIGLREEIHSCSMLDPILYCADCARFHSTRYRFIETSAIVVDMGSWYGESVEERVSAEYGPPLPPCLGVQSVFLCFPEDVLTIFYEVAVHALTMVNKIFLASKAFVAEFAHDWWDRGGLASCF